ncbi:TIGR02300 family protein [Pelagibacterium luteolum]|uniref:TIGR02300 family protein n=1 Tax=Pelagibacterium luteolum TaxID=440168 RepID=A0A1G7SPL9_9HYPH|nr:TIGR02300 family protein [Pelagibacterium luteolum]
MNGNFALATDERGIKRTCPVTGRKFYDLNKDPVVSPYTGKSYPLSFFETLQEKNAAKFSAKERKVEKEEEDEIEEADVDVAAEEAGAEVISINDAEKSDDDDDDDDDSADDIPDVEDVEVDDELGGDDEDTFLESDDDEDDIDFDVEVDEDER